MDLVNPHLHIVAARRTFPILPSHAASISDALFALATDVAVHVEVASALLGHVCASDETGGISGLPVAAGLEGADVEDP